MRSSLILNLVSYKTLPSNFSDEGERVPVKRKIYGNAFSVDLDTSIKAQREGFRLNGQVEIYTFEYEGEEDLEINDKIYRILNAKTRGDKTVLSYGEVIANGNQSSR